MARTAAMTGSGRHGRRAFLVGLCAQAVAWAMSRGAAAEAPPFRVLIHPDNPQASAARDFVADAFLRKTTDWPDGHGIRPVDLQASSATRSRFSESVLKRSVAAVKHYWQQIIFSGRGVPPPELESDAAVIAYVLHNRGSIGYVSGTGDIGKAKVLTIR
jgi:hypothetical protein